MSDFLRELRRDAFLLSEPPEEAPLERRDRTVVIDQATFDAVGDYTRSLPTGPSAGRVYRKNLGWPPDMDDNWFLYVVIDAPDGDGQLHVPYSVLVVT